MIEIWNNVVSERRCSFSAGSLEGKGVLWLLFLYFIFFYELIYEFHSFSLTLSFLFDLVTGEKSLKDSSKKDLNNKKVESEFISDKNKRKNDKDVKDIQEKLGMTTVNKKSPQAEKTSGGKDVT